MYFPFLELQKWHKRSAEIRRRNCAMLPLLFYHFARKIVKSNLTIISGKKVWIFLRQGKTYSDRLQIGFCDILPNLSYITFL